MKIKSLSLALITLSCFNVAFAEDVQESKTTKVLDKITVTSELNEKIAGSATFLPPEQFEKAKNGFDDIHSILRRVPGVNIQEEDGFGLRPNIGFRGTDTERSSSITLMEDSVLIAPAPYAAPSAYFFPTAGRMESLEVTKGPGQIKYGPRTTGGSLNLFSTSIPEESSRVRAKIGFGDHNSTIAHYNAGGSTENFGWLLEGYNAESDGFKRLDNGGDTGFQINDYVGKFRINSDADAENYQELEFKFNVYDQKSDETYLGLTREDFRNDPFRRYAASALDNIKVDHSQLQLRHYLELSDQLSLTSTIYRNDTDRNWFKIEGAGGNTVASIFSNPEEFATELAYLRGDLDSPEGTFNLRNNNRDYLSQGIQSQLAYNFTAGGAEHDLAFGIRYHKDEEDRFQSEDLYQIINGSLVLNEIGAPGSNANRIASATAWAYFIQDEIDFGRLKVTPGVRFESISLERKDFGRADPTRSGNDLVTVRNQVDEVIPGVSAYYDLTKEFGVFAGMHRGFAPPTPSSNNQVDAEESINYEAGFDYKTKDFFSKLVFFYNDYENLLGADTVSSGGTGTGDLFNAGESTVFGIESSLAYDLASLLADDSGLKIPVNLVYTFTNADFEDTFESDLFGNVNSGDSIPYIAENQLYFDIGLAQELWNVTFSGSYTDAMNTTADRSTPDTDSYFTFDLDSEVELKPGVRVFAGIKNIFDREYVVAERPAGSRPGLPRTFLAGLKIDL